MDHDDYIPNLGRLYEVCSADPSRPAICEPWNYAATGGTKWAVAVNGRVLAAIQTDNAVRRVTEANPPALEKVLVRDEITWRAVPGSTLIEWLMATAENNHEEPPGITITVSVNGRDVDIDVPLSKEDIPGPLRMLDRGRGSIGIAVVDKGLVWRMCVALDISERDVVAVGIGDEGSPVWFCCGRRVGFLMPRREGDGDPLELGAEVGEPSTVALLCGGAA